MNLSNDASILLLGLAGTGKTNFLVGLDVVLENRSDPNGLIHSSHAPDRSYLQPLREQWHCGEELAHTTRQAAPTPHQLLVYHPASGTRTTFHIPDLAGETFSAQFATRSFPEEFRLRVQQAAGIMLFVHSDEPSDHVLLERPEFIDMNPAPQPDHTTPISTEANEWSIEKASKQAKLVDLLQFLEEVRGIPLRVAIAISAWDLVDSAPEHLVPKDPSIFLKKQWPLLAQFLESNREVFPSRMFGVSARGGGNSAEEIARLVSLPNPRDRVLIVDGTHRSGDLTRPVRWLLGILDTLPASNG